MNSRSLRGSRFLAYGLAGWVADSLFVFVHTGQRRPSNLLNIPVYGLAQPLFEPLHDRIRHRPVALRAVAYGVGILCVEYASGRVFRRVAGRVPWSYEGARSNVDGLIRLDYFPLWAAFGLGLERLHDALVGRAYRLHGDLGQARACSLEVEPGAEPLEHRACGGELQQTGLAVASLQVRGREGRPRPS